MLLLFIMCFYFSEIRYNVLSIFLREKFWNILINILLGKVVYKMKLILVSFIWNFLDFLYYLNKYFFFGLVNISLLFR